MISLNEVANEVSLALESVDVESAGEHLYSNYQYITGILIRFQEIHNQIALEEIAGTASPELKKFRTLILDESITRLERVAAFESRKITAQALEAQLDR